MNFVTGVFVYFLTFWTVLFAILPYGNHAPDVKAPGDMPGAPANPRIKQKFIVTAIVSAVIWLIIYWLIKIDIINFHDFAMQMIAEDEAQQ